MTYGEALDAISASLHVHPKDGELGPLTVYDLSADATVERLKEDIQAAWAAAGSLPEREANGGEDEAEYVETFDFANIEIPVQPGPAWHRPFGLPPDQRRAALWQAAHHALWSPRNGQDIPGPMDCQQLAGRPVDARHRLVRLELAGHHWRLPSPLAAGMWISCRGFCCGLSIIR